MKFFNALVFIICLLIVAIGVAALINMRVVATDKDQGYLFRDHMMQMSGCVEKGLYTNFYFKPVGKEHTATDQLLMWKCGSKKDE